jgi:hypothetical protein
MTMPVILSQKFPLEKPLPYTTPGMAFNAMQNLLYVLARKDGSNE